MKIKYAHNWKELDKILSDITMHHFPLKIEWKNGKLYRIKFCNIGDWKRLRRLEVSQDD